ncbi:MAG: biotin attachment protein [Planctomycetaceae bacterium]|nr:MAG: biotin attachment protein [Planctomycetaceae bacterium]
MPKWGMTMQEGTVGSWLKAEGDRVGAGEEIVEIESDKAIQWSNPPPRAPRPDPGHRREPVPITTPIAVIVDEGEEVPEEMIAAATAARLSPTPTLAGTPDRRRPPPDQTPPRGGRVPASPAAKRLGREHDIDWVRSQLRDPTAGRGRGCAGAIDGVHASRPRLPGCVLLPGTRLEGRLYLPEQLFESDTPVTVEGPGLPGVVLCLGYTYTPDLLGPEMARQLAQSGRACLVFDYRGFGRSGEPVEGPQAAGQVEDIRAAVLPVRTRRSRCLADALLGISLGGSHAVTAAAVDLVSRRATVSAAGDLRPLLQGRETKTPGRFQDRVDADRPARPVVGTARPSMPGRSFNPDADSGTFLDQLYPNFPRTGLPVVSGARRRVLS